MIADPNVMELISASVENRPLILDPVMVATSGDVLLPDKAILALKQHLLPKAFLLTPNIPEAEVLSGVRIHDIQSQIELRNQLHRLGKKCVNQRRASRWY